MILVLNVGSTSVKYELFDGQMSVAEGAVTNVGEGETVISQTVGGETAEEETDIADHTAAIEAVLSRLTGEDAVALEEPGEIEAVGHRVVHGGPLSEPQLIDSAVVKTIERYASIAPLHNPANLRGIEGAEAALPDLPHVAVFDTAFHETMPPKAYRYGLPNEYYKDHRIRRYGFHGISHEYVGEEAASMLDQPFSESTLITCHLGGGCSVAAIENGRSVDTSMGFSPLEGLLMATRAGDLDPAVVQYLVDEVGMDLDRVFDVLNHESGFAGLSGVSDDLREVLEAAGAGDERAELAVDVFVYRIVKYVGAYAAVLGDVDGLVFTAGIGENAPTIRKRVCTAPGLGTELDDEANRAAIGERAIVSTADAEIPVLVVPTDEELMIARETARVADTA
ncbi:acetate kinase [Halolamina litorea]|uniref:Acetate kinase n=1 Tax=Halolamina litorea TaxID=1515593 RepID=A0ABD6BUD0_9EURY|nr:acetate kinase [Halolamina litorea]